MVSNVFFVWKKPQIRIKVSHVNGISGHRLKVNVNVEVKKKTQLYLLLKISCERNIPQVRREKK